MKPFQQFHLEGGTKQKLIYILLYKQGFMTLSINCKDAGDPVCTHTMYGETEEELIKNAKEHGIKEHGYTEETWNEKMSKDQEKFKNLIKSS